MKWSINKEDLEEYRLKFGGIVAGYVEEYNLFGLQKLRYYIMIVDKEKITIVQLNMKIEQKSVESIMIQDITNLGISGGVNKKVFIQTGSKKYRFLIKSMAMGIREEQQQLISGLEDINQI